eukprot:CAMPEP_0206122726 /NCGR_PEP_ID=MMETSP1472-20131121/2301_1 /ASSEMBLY_ACC=CAM_ASM_001108 /TAXON_ID=41880 /ORGANISM="Pycnococcus provasolii, Strain RCC251" /LENGTH=78 /DNA_ID=CAMNT_0053513223 /DNA_START=572 /DNA_END=808 /DNA_ORIENTATION=-
MACDTRANVQDIYVDVARKEALKQEPLGHSTVHLRTLVLKDATAQLHRLVIVLRPNDVDVDGIGGRRRRDDASPDDRE